MSQYAYTTRRPNHRWSPDELVLPIGHRMGLKVRRDKLIAGPTALSYKPYCICGWQTSKDWMRPKSACSTEFRINHIRFVERQGVLDV